MAITTMEQFRDYIKTQLGYPVINVEVSNTQINNIITDSVDFFNKFNTAEGSTFEYAIFNVSAGVSEYVMSGVEGAFDLELSLGIDGINTLFSPSHELLYSDFVRKGSIFGGDTPDYSPGMVLTSWESAMTFLQEVKNKFGKRYTVKHNPNTQILTVHPTPGQNGTGILYLYRQEEAVNLYNHPLMKELTIARTRELWGHILGKSILTMPDGITLNGVAIQSKGEADRLRIEQDIKDQSEPPDFFMG